MTKIKKILIAIDGGPTSEKIASYGLQLGKQLRAEMALLSVADVTGLLSEGSVTPQQMAGLIKKDLEKKQQLLLESVFKNEKVWNFVEEGTPHEKILNVAKEWEADVLLLGTHGRTGLTHLLMGSVAEKILRHSSIPVYIIPTHNGKAAT